jgi:multisubunit Na+/H+ antiporter MnhF subunit
MSTPYVPPASDRGELDYSYYEDDAGYGLVTFAGVMLLIVGVLNTLYGIAAIDKANFYVNDAKYVFGNLQTWGWFLVILGVAQLFAAFAIWRGTTWGRWFGVACASVNAILQMLWIPAYPVLAITLLAIDIAIIYGLLAYGGRRKAARAARGGA